MISRRRWRVRFRWLRPVLLVTAINVVVFAFTAGPAIAQSIRTSGGLSLGTANSLFCALTGCTMTGKLTVVTGTGCGSGSYSITSNPTTVTGFALDASGTLRLCGGGGDAFDVTGGGLRQINGNLTLANGALLSSTATMTNAGSGSCTSVTVTGTVLDGTITATCTAAQTVVVTFSTGFGASPNCTITSANAAAGGVTTGTPYQSAGATTSATFTFPAVTAGKYNVICAL